MLLNVLNIVYLLVSIAMVGFILLQRGPGATAGSGFGAGASATVFGARGSANFLSRSTAVLALMFFLLSLGMAVYVSRSVAPAGSTTQDLGVMSSVASSGDDAETGASLEPAADSTVISQSADGSATISQSIESAPAAESGDNDAEAPAAAPEAVVDAPQEDSSGQ